MFAFIGRAFGKKRLCFKTYVERHIMTFVVNIINFLSYSVSEHVNYATAII